MKNREFQYILKTIEKKESFDWVWWALIAVVVITAVVAMVRLA